MTGHHDSSQNRLLLLLGLGPLEIWLEAFLMVSWNKIIHLFRHQWRVWFLFLFGLQAWSYFGGDQIRLTPRFSLSFGRRLDRLHSWDFMMGGWS